MKYFPRTHEPQQAGFFRLIVAFIILAGVLFYFEIDVRGFFENAPELENFIERIFNVLGKIWNDFILPIIAGVFEVLVTISSAIWNWPILVFDSLERAFKG